MRRHAALRSCRGCGRVRQALQPFSDAAGAVHAGTTSRRPAAPAVRGVRQGAAGAARPIPTCASIPWRAKRPVLTSPPAARCLPRRAGHHRDRLTGPCRPLGLSHLAAAAASGPPACRPRRASASAHRTRQVVVASPWTKAGPAAPSGQPFRYESVTDSTGEPRWAPLGLCFSTASHSPRPDAARPEARRPVGAAPLPGAPSWTAWAEAGMRGPAALRGRRRDPAGPFND